MKEDIAILPCGILNVHELFGEIKSSVITEGKDQIIEKLAERSW